LTCQHRRASPDRAEDQTVKLHARTRTRLAWSLWLATFGCCAAGLVVTLALTRPLTLAILAEGAAFAQAFPLGVATIGLVMTLPTGNQLDNPFGLPGPAGTVAAVAAVTGVLLHWASLPAAAVCVVLRFRASRGVERQQLRWVAAGATGAVVGLLAVVEQTVQPTRASLWLRPPAV